jgi:polysaccharide biosynthesis transport protein
MNAETERNFVNIDIQRNLLLADAATETWNAPGARFWRPRGKLEANLQRSYGLRFLLGFSIVVITSAMVWPFLPRRYEATATIILHPKDPESGSESTQLMRQPLDESAIEAEIDKINSPTLAAAVLAKHKLAADPEFNGGAISWLRQRLFGQTRVSDIDLRQRLLSNLAVSRDRHSYTVKFGFRSSDRFKAAALTDTLLKAYLADQLARKRAFIADLTGWLTERVDLLRAKSEASRLAVKDFLVQSGLIDKGAQISLEHELATLSTEAALAQSRAMDAQARADALSDLQKAGKLDSAPEVLASPVIQSLKEKTAGAKSMVSPVETRQTASEAEITAEADRIARGVKTEARASTQHEISLQLAIKTIRDEMTKRQSSELRVAALRDDAASDRHALDDALMLLNAQSARANAVIPDVDIIANPEVPERPVFPNPLLAMLGTLVAGCLAGAAMVWRPIAGWGRRVLAM